jgi:prolyl-tRNA synthetase
MVLADSGEDAIVECSACSYAANIERAERRIPTDGDAAQAAADAAIPAMEEIPTPGAKTIQQVAAFLGCAPSRLVKTLLYVADGKPLAVLVPGDRDVNEHKVARELGAAVLTLADDATILSLTGAPVGFAGPAGLNIPLYADASLRGAGAVVTGANKADTHVRNVSLARDAKISDYKDLCIVRADDLCPRCGAPLRECRGVEVGHVFKLGTKYSQAFNAVYLDEAGQTHPMVMGCYGIGVTRTLQAVIEQSHDANGIVWPAAVAPYAVAVLPLNATHAPSLAAAEGIAAQLENAGVETLLDDRDERPGVKLKDADLVGFPVRVVVSERSLAKGQVEIRRRATGETVFCAPEEATARISSLLAAPSGTS